MIGAHSERAVIVQAEVAPTPRIVARVDASGLETRWTLSGVENTKVALDQMRVGEVTQPGTPSYRACQ